MCGMRVSFVIWLTFLVPPFIYFIFFNYIISSDDNISIFSFSHFYRWQEKLPYSKSPLESTWLYHEIGRCYLELGKYSEARDYGEKSLAAANEADDDGWQLHASVLVAQSEGMKASQKYFEAFKSIS